MKFAVCSRESSRESSSEKPHETSRLTRFSCIVVWSSCTEPQPRRTSVGASEPAARIASESRTTGLGPVIVASVPARARAASRRARSFLGFALRKCARVGDAEVGVARLVDPRAAHDLARRRVGRVLLYEPEQVDERALAEDRQQEARRREILLLDERLERAHPRRRRIAEAAAVGERALGEGLVVPRLLGALLGEEEDDLDEVRVNARYESAPGRRAPRARSRRGTS